LTGEAFFQVRHNADKPFIIHAGDAVIRDIGTSFNVKEERNGEVVVAVKEGIASLRSSKASKDQAAVLKRDQIGIMDKGRLTAVKQISI
jgi:ferric-dicitrate binding protein FerR (iron transport regulator)